MYSTNKTGTIGDLSAMQAFISAGFSIYIPLSGKEECDFIACKGLSLLRVQVKSTSVKDRNGSYTVQLKRIRNNSSVRKIHKFDALSCDILAVYIQPIDRLCFLHSSEIKNTCTMSFRDSYVDLNTKLVSVYSDLNRTLDFQ